MQNAARPPRRLSTIWAENAEREARRLLLGLTTNVVDVDAVVSIRHALEFALLTQAYWRFLEEVGPAERESAVAEDADRG